MAEAVCLFVWFVHTRFVGCLSLWHVAACISCGVAALVSMQGVRQRAIRPCACCPDRQLRHGAFAVPTIETVCVFGKGFVWGDRDRAYQLGLEGRAGTVAVLTNQTV